jgi:phage/plasmid-associated DNA primase
LLVQGRYTLPQSSQAAVKDWKRQADQVLAFVEERTTRLALDAPIQDGERGSDLYKAYRGWASLNGHRPLASNKFGQRMAMLELGSQRTMTGARYPVTLTHDEHDEHDGLS